MGGWNPTWKRENGPGRVVIVMYQVEWKGGREHGQGKITYKSGDVYDGGWKDGIRHGQVKITCKNGNVYEGKWYCI